VLASQGHTPGHCCVELTSAHDRLIYLSDATLHTLHVEHPDWHPLYDLDASGGERSRRDILKRASSDNTLVLGFHFPFPGIGKITRDDDGYRFVPATAGD
jgi:glyoxylase-like metal-dependent hydrolase (beta-lactamase superfamily II)